MKQKIINTWPWITAALGLILMVINYISAAEVAVWFDEHGLPDDLSIVPPFLVELLGLIITAGSILVAIASRRGRGIEATRDR